MIWQPRKSSRILLVLILWSLSLCAIAHEIKPAIVDINYVGQEQDKQLIIELIVNIESLMAEIGPSHDDTEESANSARYEQLRKLNPDSLLKAFADFEEHFLSNINMTDANGTRLSLSIDAIHIPTQDDINIARDTTITLISPLPEGVFAASWQWNAAFGEVIVRANSDSQEMDFATLLAPGQKTTLIQFTSQTVQSAVSTLWNYAKIGFVHILPKGLDHILFVIGLFLLSIQWRALIAQVTTFTLAHSITLALGATNTLSVSPSIVEPLIALSIVFVCAENLLTSNLGKWRLATVFVFGLLHGLGFASVLDGVGLDGSNFIPALLGFNLGVEIGQLVVIAVCLLAVGVWIGKKTWYRNYFCKPASIVIGLIGVFWFVQRTWL